VKTTVRENYFIWIFQQLCDSTVISDEEIQSFKMEYDDDFCKDPPETLVCTFKHTTRFPSEKCELVYDPRTNDADPADSELEVEETDTAAPRNDFKIIPKTPRKNAAFMQARKRQHNNVVKVARESAKKYEKILRTFKTEVEKVRSNVLLHGPENRRQLKVTVAGYKRHLRLLEDNEQESNTDDNQVQEPLRKKARRKSASNKTRFSDSKVTYLYEANEEMKKMEEDGRRKMWESVYKQICNNYILKKKEEDVKDTLPETSKMTRDIEDDVKQLLADCGGEIEEL
jgi:hypothetical protein